MKEEDKELDQLFKKRLQDTEKIFAYHEEDWTALEARLDKADKKVAVMHWVRIGSGIAAILLLSFGLWFLNKPTVTNTAHFSAQRKNKPVDSKPLVQVSPDSVVQQNELVAQLTTASQFNNSRSPIKQAYTAPKVPIQNITSPTKLIKDSVVQTAATIAKTVESTVADTQEATLNTKDVPSAATTVAQTTDGTDHLLSPIAAKGGKPKREKKMNRIVLAISAVASSDLNGSRFLGQSKVGNNIGALLDVQLSEKITIQAGVMYSNKPYQGNSDSYLPTYGSNPYAAKYKPISVDVVCKMLDLPLNINYQFFKNNYNKLSLGTGLSSYMMLHENYQYNFDPASAYAAKNYEVPNSKTYLFSILNLNATYERRLNQKIGLIVQPYFKLPLREVGYGNVKLHSAGLAVGLKLNLNSSKAISSSLSR